MSTSHVSLAALALALLTGCGGGSSSSSRPTVATALTYANPVTSADFNLVQNVAASTSTRLVLDLVAGTTQSSMGVAFFLTVDSTKATWSAAGGDYVTPGTVLDLGSAPKLLASKVQGGNLQVGLFQKGGTATALGSAPILSVALDLGSGVAPGTTVALAPQTGKTAVSLSALGATPGTVTIAVGTITAQ